MKLKEDNINIYNDSAIIFNNKTPSIINMWIIILIIYSLLFIVILFVPFNIYKTYNGYIVVENNESYLGFTINRNDFPINKKNNLYIKEEDYQYKVINIENNNVLLKINLKEDIKINNNRIEFSILKDRTTLFKIIKNKIKKGFGL